MNRKLIKKRVLIWNVITDIASKLTIRLTVRRKYNNEHIYFKCNVMNRAFWYKIFVSSARKNKKIKLYLINGANAFATHNLHLFPRETFAELASVTCCRKCNVGHVHDGKNVEGIVKVSPKHMSVTILDATILLERNGRYDIVQSKNGYKAHMLRKHLHSLH